MKTITALDILKALPLEPKFKEEILSKYPDGLTPAEKLVYDEMAWKQYDEYFKIKHKENIELEILAIKEGKAELMSDFESRMRKKTEEDMEHWLFEANKDDREIEKVRTKLKNILNASSQPS